MAGNTDILSLKISVAGSPIDDSDGIIEVTTFCGINRVASAQIVIIDGDTADRDFKISSSETFIPGKEIEIQAGIGTATSTIFKGVIVGQNITIQPNHKTSLTVECKDKAIKMTVGRKTATFSKKKDSDIMHTLISNSGASASVDSTNIELAQLVQYCSTDWDMLISRAEVNGMIVVNTSNSVNVGKPKLTSSGKTYTFGEDIFEFDSNLNADTQLKAVDAHCWDYSQQKLVSGSGTKPTAPGQSNLTSEKLSAVASPDKVNLVTTSKLETQSLSDWAGGQLLKAEFSKIRGTIRVTGSSSIKLNETITLKGLGDRFNGDAYVSAITNRIQSGTWWADITTGISSEWFTETVETSIPPAAGLLPGIRGLQNATVKSITNDPDNEYRVQVTIPGMTADGSTGELWARWLQPYATDSAGIFFMPEIGDEVIIAFLNEDPGYPVIMGGVYSSKKKPPTDPASDNPIKAIVSKEKLTVKLDDKNKVITINTPGNNQVILSDQDKGITIKDQNGNQIVMNDSGIEIKSASDININATGELKMQAASLSASYEGEATISADASLSISGGDISISGDASFQASAPEAKVSGDGMLTLQGGMVSIN